ncbi:MAG: methyl-accepting chemotaxis protein [Candidatus Omnitrophota bacterium]|nr:methyl-accepting chemotaxis protein [Candidatus Omnitrophota bacterium]
MSKFRRRTRLFIARRFQIRYVTLILIFMFATAILSGYTVYVTTWIIFGEKLAAVYPQGLLLGIVKKVNIILLLRLIFLTPLIILVGLVLSNRIAGPIYRIQRFLRRVSSGNYENRLYLREKDELHDLAEALNHLMSKLRSEREARLDKIQELKSETDDLEAALIAGKGDRESLLKKIMRIREDINTFRC